MKKLPVLLSTLTVAASLTGGMSTILTQERAWALEDVTQTNRENIYSNELSVLAKYVQFEWFDFGANLLRVETGGTANSTGIRAQKLVVAYRDFENGVTEEEADMAARTLGESASTDLLTLVEAVQPAQGNTLKPLKGKKLTDNLTDIIYFAVQFGHENADKNLEDEYWVRGKLDYRNCIHSTVFEPENMLCTRDTSTGVVQFLPATQNGDWVTVPSDDQVITWETEWKKEVERRLAVMDEWLQHIKTELPDTDSTLYLMGKELAQLQLSTSKLENMAEVDQKMLNLEQTLQEVRTMLGWMIGECQQEIMNELQNSLSTAQNNLVMMQKQVETLKTQLLQAKNEVELANDARQEAQAKLDQGYRALEEAQIELARVVAESQNLQKCIQELEAKLKLGAGENETMQAELGKAQQEIKRLMQEKANLTQQIVELAAKNAELMRELQNLDTNNKVEGAEMAIEAEDTALKLENEALKMHNQQLEQENESLRLQMRWLQQELVRVSTVQVGEVKVGEKPLDEAAEAGNESIISTPVEMIDEVEVPNLGETEVKVNLWWALAVIVGMLGAMSLWCKRWLNKR